MDARYAADRELSKEGGGSTVYRRSNAMILTMDVMNQFLLLLDSDE